ncbi:pectin acetylesterase 11 [Sesamum indicum]|uniref:Pectin acetylesterase n=1 Tax=Sesamum indicum TaxID=4182 RepID=A0A6I9SXD6_SESIN|nr:pectin acetylesterase 11 [Sesamum indicum]
MENHIQTMADHWIIRPLICILIVMATQVHGSDWTTITFLPSAISKGAVCLDGSPPAYYFRKGFGDGIDNWVIFLEGGGWCASNKGCLDRTNMSTGSTKLKEKRHYFKDILSSNHTINPNFYNWNRVYVGYCDGSSYTGDVEENTYPTRRGAKIFDVVMEDMLAQGMKNAKNAILSGGSAGAWGAILHCDGFRKLIPKASRVKCISDSGFFIHAKNLYGAKKREEYFADLIAYHRSNKFLPASCTSKMNASLCLFPENIIKDIKTPIFFLESAFDYYQLKEHYFSDDPTWKICVDNLKVCTPTQLQIMKDYRATFIKELQGVKSSSTGIFVHSCYRHGHLHEREGWDKSPKLGNKTVAEAISDWYFDRSSFQEIDTQNELPRNCAFLS